MLSNGKYEVIFRTASGKTPAVGDVGKVKAGDVVTYFEDGWRTTEVEKVVGKFAKKVKIKPVMYGASIVRKGRILAIEEIKEVLRPLPVET